MEIVYVVSGGKIIQSWTENVGQLRVKELYLFRVFLTTTITLWNFNGVCDSNITFYNTVRMPYYKFKNYRPD
jgi:hypothetical protein